MDIERWRSWARVEKNLAPRTIEGYERNLKLLGPDIATLQTADLRVILYSSGGSASTVAGRLASWRSFYGFLVRTDARLDDPTAKLDRPKLHRGLPHPVKDAERRIVMLDPPYRHMAVVLLETGLRISELKAIQEDVPVGDELVVLGKGSKTRIVPLTLRARQALDELGGHIDKSVRAIERAFSMVGTHPHALRHTFATDLITSGADLGDVQELLGHSSPATTKVYAAYSTSRLRAAIERRSARPS